MRGRGGEGRRGRRSCDVGYGKREIDVREEVGRKAATGCKYRRPDYSMGYTTYVPCTPG